jgi:hypothetical protein
MPDRRLANRCHGSDGQIVEACGEAQCVIPVSERYPFPLPAPLDCYLREAVIAWSEDWY